jgi:rhodanese-related sulfurtransferase
MATHDHLQNPSGDYAGDLSAAAAWDRLKSDPAAQLVDVRTIAEWSFVGLPDLSSIARQTHCVEWQSFPSMAANSRFIEEAAQSLARTGASQQTPVFFLCRSGGRSRAAATAMAQAGYTQAYNIAGGFEGEPDGKHHRGTISGWKAAGLPWKQS